MNWINLENQEPPTEIAVLVCDEVEPDFVCLGVLRQEVNEPTLYCCHILPLPTDFSATHWMPLPEAPK